MSVTLYGQGQTVLQVFQSVNNIQNSTTSLTPVASNISAGFTPLSANSKLLITVNLASVINTIATGGIGVFLYRNGNLVFSPTYQSSNGCLTVVASSQNGQSIAFTCSLPATSTTSQTFTIYFGAYNGGTAYLNYTTAGPSLGLSQSAITILEISGS